jgi:hypothetical protein
LPSLYLPLTVIPTIPLPSLTPPPLLSTDSGVYSSPESLLYRAAQQATFPDNTYASDSGGDPATIPDLTFEQFTAFHDAYYHPANSRIFFYGDDDVASRLELLDSYLAPFDAPMQVLPAPDFGFPPDSGFPPPLPLLTCPPTARGPNLASTNPCVTPRPTRSILTLES